MWVKLDDGICENKKILAIGPNAFAVYVAGLVYCGKNLTDGFIPEIRLRSLLDQTKITVARRILVERRLWEEVPGGIQVHDYLDYNPSKAQVQARRRATDVRVTRLRERQPEEPRMADDNVTPLQEIGERECNAVSRPDPTRPVKTKKHISSFELEIEPLPGLTASDEKKPLPKGWKELVEHYLKKSGKSEYQLKGKVGQKRRAILIEAFKEAPLEDLIAAVDIFYSHPRFSFNREQGFHDLCNYILKGPRKTVHERLEEILGVAGYELEGKA
jgi:hypothetical protein